MDLYQSRNMQRSKEHVRLQGQDENSVIEVGD